MNHSSVIYLSKIHLIIFALFFCTSARAQYSVYLSGKPLVYNGTDKIPVGLFGVHAGNFPQLSAAVVQEWGIESVRAIQTVPSGNTYNAPAGISQVVDCWFDRFQPARNVEKPNSWKPDFYNWATQYHNNTSGSTKELILEFWNEPYLNWAYKPGVNTDPQYYEQMGVVAGDPVVLKGQTQPQPYLVWKNTQWYNSPKWAANRQGVYVGISNAWNQQLGIKGIPYPGLTGALVDGEVYNLGGSNEFTVTTRLRPVDTTQQSFYSARQNSVYYNEMFGVLVDTIKKLNPNIKLAAGWGFEPHVDNHTGWKNLYKPLIDQHHAHIFAIHEHHYGMDTRIVAADYEMMYAYAKTNYGTSLKFINTETGGFLDPQRPEGVSNSAGAVSNKQKALNAFTYNARDIMYLLAYSADKAYARAIHEPQNTNGGVKNALKILKNLRGNLLHSYSYSPADLWTVASLKGDSVVTWACFNNSGTEKTAELFYNVPAGATLEAAMLKWADTTATDDTLISYTQSLSNVPGSEYSFESNIILPPYSLRVIELKLNNASVPGTPANITLHYADSILQHVTAGSSKTFPLTVDGTSLAGAGSCRLRAAVMNANGDDIEVLINGNPVSLAYSGDTASKNKGGLSFAEVPVSYLSASNTIEFKSKSADYDVWMAALELSTEDDLKLGEAKTNAGKTLMTAVYPNPFSSEVTFEIQEESLIKIYNLTGGLILQTSGKKVAVSTESWAPGLYIYHVNSAEGKSFNIGKIIKK